MAKQKIVVGLAQVESCYGGPEEGGWDFEVGTPITDFPVKTFFRPESAYAYRNWLRSQIAEGTEFRGVACGGCGDDEGMTLGEVSNSGLDAVVQYLPKDAKSRLRCWPSRRPHYE